MNSEVFKSLDPQLGGEFAVKWIEKAKFGGDISKYFEEAKVMFATTHPNVVPIQYACETASHVMLAMPYYANGSLASRIKSAPVSIKEFIRIAIGILNGVAQIHSAGYIHFDLKPSNVLFNDVDDPLVSDFGQTRKVLPGGVVTMPPMYQHVIPPETLSTGVGTTLGDIYQLGLLFYRVVNGNSLYESQFSGSDWATKKPLIISGKLPNRKIFLPHVPKRVRSIIRKALNSDPTKRYQSAVEFSKVIARIGPGIDWETKVDLSGEMAWRASRPGKADLEVELLSVSGNWNVSVHTVNGSSRRVMGSTTLNRTGLDRATALAHLDKVFIQLA